MKQESNEVEIQRVKKELFELTIQEATLSLERLTNEEDVTTRTSEAKDMAADAQREAETARQAAQDAQQRHAALLLEYRQKAQERATAVWEQIQILETDGGERQKNWISRSIDLKINWMHSLDRVCCGPKMWMSMKPTVKSDKRLNECGMNPFVWVMFWFGH